MKTETVPEQDDRLCHPEWEAEDWDTYKLWDQQVRPIATRVWLGLVIMAVAAAVVYLAGHPASTMTRTASATSEGR